MPTAYQIKYQSTPHYLTFHVVFYLGLFLKPRQGGQLQRITQQYTEGNITINKLWAGACEYITENGKQKTLTYLSGPEGVFALHVKNPNGTENIRYIHKAHLGSWHTITDESGNLLQELSFDAWGNRRNPETGQPFESPPPPLLFDRGYTGHEHIEKFALINMNGRVYDPKVARFLSPDPLIQSPGFSQSFNRYSYSLNNPINLVDRSGYYWDDYDEDYDGFYEWDLEERQPRPRGKPHCPGDCDRSFWDRIGDFFRGDPNSWDEYEDNTNDFSDYYYLDIDGYSIDYYDGYDDYGANGGGEIWYYGVQRDRVGDVGHSLVRTPDGIIYEINHPDYGQIDGLQSWIEGGPKAVVYRYDMSRDADFFAFWSFGNGRKMVTWQPVYIPNPQASRNFFESWVGSSWDYNFFNNNCKHYIYLGLSIGGASIIFRTNVPAEWPRAYSTPWYSPY